MTALSTASSKTGYSDDFSSNSSLNRSLWSVKWGNSDDFSFKNGALTLRSTSGEGWSNTGFMQSDYGASSGTGYGVYTAVASLDSGQGGGVCIDLWPSNNVWPGAEIDMLETSGGERNTAYANIHWATSSDGNGDSYHAISLNLTAKNSFSIDWEKGSLTYSINGKEIFSTTSHVPLDAANGGVNESFGAEVTGAKYSASGSQTDLNLYSMSYSPSGSSSHAVSGSTTTAAATASDTVTSAATATSASAMQFITSNNATVAVTAGEKLTEQGAGNTLALPSAGSVSLSGNILSDTLDLKSAMSASGWNGQAADLSKYVSATTSSGGANLDVLVHKASGASVLAMTLVGQGHTSLATVEAHSLFG